MATQVGARAGTAFFGATMPMRGVVGVAYGSDTWTSGALADILQLAKLPQGAVPIAIYRKLDDMDSGGIPARVMKFKINGGGGGDLETGLGPAAVAAGWGDMAPQTKLTADATLECEVTTAAATHANGAVTVMVLYVWESA